MRNSHLDSSISIPPSSSPVATRATASSYNFLQEKPKVRKSHIYDKGNGETILVDGKLRWQCNQCTDRLAPRTFAASSTRNAIDHLRRCHQIGPEGQVASGPTSAQLTIQAAFGNNAPKIEFNADIFHSMLIHWVTAASVPFSVCNHPAFRTLLAYLGTCRPNLKTITKVIPQSGHTLRHWLDEFHDVMFKAIKQSLQSALCRIHFSFDLWSGPNMRAYMAIVAHWVDPNFKLHAVLLDLHRFIGAHTGKNQAAYFWTTIQKYEIGSKIGKFNIDNASNNDTALQEISQIMQLHNIPPIHPVHNRLRCFGHVINLVVKGFLWGEDRIAIVNAGIEGHHSPDEEHRQLREWRKKGPLGKLHNIITYIRRTPQRLDQFSAALQSTYPGKTIVLPIVGNLTRWSSDYESLKRALQIKEAISSFIATAIGVNRNGERAANDTALINDDLSDEDWSTLGHIMEILEPFAEWSTRLQVKYNNGCIANILPLMDELKEILENAKNTPRYNSRHILSMLSNALRILSNYYKKTEVCPSYIVAVVLNPGMKMEYFEVQWDNRPDAINLAKNILNNMWVNTYKGKYPASTVLTQQDNSSLGTELGNACPSTQPKYKFQTSFQRKRQVLMESEGIAKLAQYLQEPISQDIDMNLIEYWSNMFNIRGMRNLAQMALEILSIPAMSAEPERIFSGARITLTDRRCSMGDDALAKLECTKSWIKDNFLPVTHPELQMVQNLLDALVADEAQGGD